MCIILYTILYTYILHRNWRVFSKFSQIVILTSREFRLTASFIGESIVSFCTFARSLWNMQRTFRWKSWETGAGGEDIRGNAGNTWTWSRLIVFLHRLRHIYFIARETDSVLISLWHTRTLRSIWVEDRKR